MKIYEVNSLMRNAYKKSINSWEQCRFISYIIAQVNSTKKLKLTDILSFTWDKEEKQDKNTSITNEDIERLKNKAKQYLNTQYG